MHVPANLHVLIFTKTAGYRHASIPDGISMMRDLGQKFGFGVDCTEDADAFNPDSLEKYDVTVWLSTSGDVLDAAQKVAFEVHVKSGRGFVGIHSAANTEGSWAFFQTLVGARFRSHPGIHTATLRIEDSEDLSTAMLPHRWVVTDEWFDYRLNPRPRVRVLATVDEATYPGGRMGDDHPIVWRHETLGGRAWYTGLGHVPEMYADLRFQQHVLGGLLSVVQQNPANG